MPFEPARSAMRRAAAGVAFAAALVSMALSGTAAADELLKLEGGQSAIVFIVDGQGRGGEMLVNDQKQPTPIWASVLSAASVRLFIVRPGAYSVVLAPDAKPVALATVPGHATVVSLTGTAANGAYRLRAQRDLAASEIDESEVARFIDDHRLVPAAYTPTALEARGAGLTFLLRTNFF